MGHTMARSIVYVMPSDQDDPFIGYTMGNLHPKTLHGSVHGLVVHRTHLNL